MNPTIVAPSDRLSRHYARRVRQILSRFNDIRELIQHEGMKGTKVEGEVRKFLLDFLPKRYEYGSGIVIDSSQAYWVHRMAIFLDRCRSSVIHGSGRALLLRSAVGLPLFTWPEHAGEALLIQASGRLPAKAIPSEVLIGCSDKG
jgi:hypothetical protein